MGSCNRFQCRLDHRSGLDAFTDQSCYIGYLIYVAVSTEGDTVRSVLGKGTVAPQHVSKVIEEPIELFVWDNAKFIVSLGAERNLTFRNKEDYEKRLSYLLPNGSLFYMTQRTQDFWTHAVKKAATDEARISLTFRRILAERKSG